MSFRETLYNPKMWIAFDFIVGGWDIRTALQYYLEGDLWWAAVMLVLGAILIVVGVDLLRSRLETRPRGV